MKETQKTYQFHCIVSCVITKCSTWSMYLKLYGLCQFICQHSIFCKLEFEIFKIAFGAVLFCLQPGYLLSESMGKCSSWAELPCTPYSEPTPITGGQCRCDRTLLSTSTAEAQQNHTNTKHDFPEKNSFRHKKDLFLHV